MFKAKVWGIDCMSMSSYLTIKDISYGETVVSKSKFLSVIAPVKTESEAMDIINGVKLQHKTAAHNVFAYYLNNDNKIITRYSDDGEPNKTAGVPILDMLTKEGISDVCAVVTRYFGGTLLGTGGLVRAYTNAVKAALINNTILRMDLCICFNVVLDYNLYGKVNYIIPNYNIIVKDTVFTDVVLLKLVILKTEYELFTKKIIDICNGLVKISLTNEQFVDII